MKKGSLVKLSFPKKGKSRMKKITAIRRKYHLKIFRHFKSSSVPPAFPSISELTTISPPATKISSSTGALILISPP
jgi:hypothetical protein